VEITPGGFEALLCVSAQACGQTVTAEDMHALLRESGIRHGILENVIEKLSIGLPAETRVLVALGTAPLPGADGWLEIRQATEGQGDSDGRVNPKERNLVWNVREGELLAIIHPAEPGGPGQSVSGEPLPAVPGAPATVTLGDNTVFAADNPCALHAAADGNLVIGADGTVTVHTVLRIPGNVDLSVGDIDFVGSLIVEGDVLSGFVLKVEKSVMVKGNVEDSTIVAGGDVTIRKGFFGHGKGKVVADGAVHVHHILNQTITSGKDVFIEAEAVNATVHAGGRILAPRAVIAGGTMDALHEVEAGVLGSADGSQVKVRAGRRGRILERIGQIDKDTKHCEKQQADVKTAVYRFVKIKVDGATLTAEQEAALGKFQEAQKQIPGLIEQMQEERAALTKELQENSAAKIVVHDTVHENVVIILNNVRKVIDSAIQAVIFTERAGVIDVRSR